MDATLTVHSPTPHSYTCAAITFRFFPSIISELTGNFDSGYYLGGYLSLFSSIIAAELYIYTIEGSSHDDDAKYMYLEKGGER